MCGESLDVDGMVPVDGGDVIGDTPAEIVQGGIGGKLCTDILHDRLHTEAAVAHGGGYADGALARASVYHGDEVRSHDDSVFARCRAVLPDDGLFDDLHGQSWD